MSDNRRLIITETMLKMGMQPKHQGFNYLRESVCLYSEKPNGEEKISTEIYAKVAQIYDVSITVVERNIRLLIQESHKTGGLLEMNECFGGLVYNNSFLLSNGELIALMAELVKYYQIKQNIKNVKIYCFN